MSHAFAGWMNRNVLKYIAIFTLLAGAAVFAQEGQRPAGRKALVWIDPSPIASRNLLWGQGAPDRAPKPPFTSIGEDTDGTQPKVLVRDAAGREWTAKFGEEAHSGVAANRIVWALGFFTDEVYFVNGGTIAGVPALKRTKDFVGPNGAFAKASFRLRDARAERAPERWTFETNPFVGTKELSGLAMVMTLINNWDIQGDRNNRIFTVGDEDHYVVTDLGATFGKMGTSPMPRSKWNVEHFQKEEFIEKADAQWIDLDYEGYGGIDKVPVAHARWFANLASQLTDDQLRDAFKAAGATDAEIQAFSRRLREKIIELQKAAGGSTR